MQPFRFNWAPVIFLLLALAVKTLGDNPTKAMEGTWTCAAATINGKPLPEATVKLLRLTLTKDRYKTEKGTEVLFESSYKTDASHHPPQINILGTEGELAGKDAEGIYSLADDKLTICYTMPGKSRPTSFESPAGSEVYLMVWQRQK